MSKYVIKVFEKQENGELTPFAVDAENAVFDLEGEGFFCVAITQSKKDGTIQVESHTAIHDVSLGALGSALYSCEQARTAMMSASKRHLLEKLLSGELELKEKNEDAAE